MRLSGRISLLERDQTSGSDVGQAVIWLEGAPAAPPAAVRAEIATENKQFLPHVIVVPVGSTVAFPNHDPFNHNVFSLSEEGPFDLGLYSRGQVRSARFERPGIIRVYCNVHSRMSAFVVVRDTPYYAQPSADGSFAITSVRPGRYLLRAWHERAPEFSEELDVPASGMADLALTLDGRGYKFIQHLDKNGKSYSQRGRRY